MDEPLAKALSISSNSELMLLERKDLLGMRIKFPKTATLHVDEEATLFNLNRLSMISLSS